MSGSQDTCKGCRIMQAEGQNIITAKLDFFATIVIGCHDVMCCLV